MLKEIRDQLIIDTKVQFPTYDKVDKYRGEFEEGSDWNPGKVNVFFQVTGDRKKVSTSAGEIIKRITTVRVFCGTEYFHDVDGLTVVEELINFYSGATLSIDNKKYHLTVEEGMSLVYVERRFEGYAFNLLIT